MRRWQLEAVSKPAAGNETEDKVTSGESVMVRGDAEDTPLVGAAQLSYVPCENQWCRILRTFR